MMSTMNISSYDVKGEDNNYNESKMMLIIIIMLMAIMIIMVGVNLSLNVLKGMYTTHCKCYCMYHHKQIPPF